MLDELNVGARAERARLHENGWRADLVTTAEAARALGIAPRTVRHRCQHGTLDGVHDEHGRWLADLASAA